MLSFNIFQIFTCQSFFIFYSNFLVIFSHIVYFLLLYNFSWLFSEFFSTIKRYRLYFFFLFIVLLCLSFYNGWVTHIYYDEEENVAASIYLSKHFLFSTKFYQPNNTFIRPLGFGVLLSYFVFPRDFYTSQYIGRVVSFIFTYLSAVMLFILYRRLGLRVLYSKLFTFLFIFAPYNIYSSTLNKPESMAVFFILFFIYLLHRYVFDGEKKLFNWLILLIFFLPMIRFELFVMSFAFLISGILFKKKHYKLFLFIFFLLFFFALSSYFYFIRIESLGNLNVITHSFIYFSKEKVFNSFFFELLKTPFVIFILIFVIFSIVKIKETKKDQMKVGFYIFLLSSFFILSLFYSAFEYNTTERYIRVIYPFVFLGLSFFSNKEKRGFINHKFLITFFVLIFLFYFISQVFYSFSKPPSTFLDVMELGDYRQLFITDKTFSEILSKNNECFNNVIFYVGREYWSFLDNLNVVVLSGDMNLSELRNREQKVINKINSSKIYYIYVKDRANYCFTPLEANYKNFLYDVYSNSKENVEKVNKLCPSLDSEAKKYLIILDKPLSYYFK